MPEASPTSTTVYQQALPEYAAPYFERLLQRAETESLQPYAQYGGARLADFTDLERQAQAGYASLGQPSALTAATSVAAQVAADTPEDAFAFARGYQPGAFTSAYAPVGIASGYGAGTLGPQYQAGQFTEGYQAGQYAPGYQAGTFTPGYTAGQFTPGYAAGDFRAEFSPTAVSAGYTAGAGPEGYTAGNLGQVSPFSGGIASFYMTPYQEAVTSSAVREIEKGAEKARTGITQAASQAGGRGGYREAIERSELQRNVLEQIGDVTAKGRAAAYESAQQQYERDRQAAMQGFQTQEAARQAQAQSGLAGFQAREAARQAQTQFGLTAQELTGRQELSAAQLQAQQEAARESARQAQAQFNLQAQQAGEQARQRAAEMGMTAQQQADASRQAQEQFRQQSFQAQEAARQAQEQARLQAFQAREAARQAQGQMGISSFQAQEAARQQAAQLGLTASQFNEQQRLASSELAARQEAAREAARQQATQFGLAGIQQNMAGQQQRLAAAQALAGMGGQQQAMGLERLSAQEAAGQRQRAMRQASLDVGYEDFLRQLNYTQGQLGFYSNILRGVPVQPQQTVSTFQQQPSLFQSILGAGLGGLGLYNALRGG